MAAEAKSDRHADDDIPAVGPAVSQPGNLWRLGNHRLLCGNALDSICYDTLLGGKCQIQHLDFAMGCGEMTSSDFTTFLTKTFEHLVANSADGSIHYAFMDWRHMQEMLEAGHAVYSDLKNLCV